MLLHYTGITHKCGESSHHAPSPSVAAVCVRAEPGWPWCLCPDRCSVWPWELAVRRSTLNSSSPRLSADKWLLGQGQHRGEEQGSALPTPVSGAAQCRGCLGMARDRRSALALLLSSPLHRPAGWKGGEKRNRNFSLESHQPKTERRSES